MPEHSGVGVPGKRILNRDRKMRKEALLEEKIGAGGINLETAKTQAKLITNPARQKLMLEVIDELKRTRQRLGRGRDRSKQQRERQKRQDAEQEFINANMARLVTDDEGRTWAVSRDLPNGAIFVDGAGITWRYNEAERHLMRINDGT